MIAFYCWSKGYFSEENSKRLQSMGDSTRLSDMEGIPYLNTRIQRNTIPSYATDNFWEAVQMWKDYKTFGFPYSGGYMDQPALYIDIVRTMQLCADKLGVA